jgi:hypothetical protein
LIWSSVGFVLGLPFLRSTVLADGDYNDYNNGNNRDHDNDGNDGNYGSDDYTVCPGLFAGTPLENEDLSVPDYDTYNRVLKTLDIKSVFNDIYELMYSSQECWPADEFNEEKSYAGLFLRLAWHSAGTYRATDHAGGSPGGRQRYQPESAWDDNANLDKARALLAPIKESYGDALSWGDLFIFAGTASILAGDGPVTEVCAGRIDDSDGSKSDVLNDPSSCEETGQGNCQEPLGSSTVGLIYVDPTGFLGNPDPWVTAPHVREVFGRMGMDDYETVALIGGGHAFGKCHGACPLGAGPGPDEQPRNPWPGLCGQNFPEDAATSGLEGQWTKYPFRWDNEFFTQLVEDEYELITGPGGKYQWYNKRNGQLMLTTDLALRSDDEYLAITKEYARNLDSLDRHFSEAWAKLVTSGGEFASNKFCVDGDSLRPDDLKCPSKCDTMDSNGKCDCTQDRHCKVCPKCGRDCTKCEKGYFIRDFGYNCESCDEVFSGTCRKCKDNVGCLKCADGYETVLDRSCGLYRCSKY